MSAFTRLTNAPETRPSLILRLGNADDADAWESFAALYSPVIYGFARKKGFQHADAQNLVQEVLAAVVKAVGSWRPDPARGRFRAWLFQITRNLAINFRSRPKYQGIGTGDTRTMQWLENQPDPSDADTSLFDREYRREIFNRAAERVRGDVRETTWRAFWLSSVEEWPIADVAANLGISPGAVYIARSRVMAKLQEQVGELDPYREGSGANESG